MERQKLITEKGQQTTTTRKQAKEDFLMNGGSAQRGIGTKIKSKLYYLL